MFERLFFFSFDMQQGHMGEGEVTTFLFNFLMFKMSYGITNAPAVSERSEVFKGAGWMGQGQASSMCMLW